MSTPQLKSRAKALIDAMSNEQLRVATEFLSFVKSREIDDKLVRVYVVTIAKRSDAYD